MNINEDDGYHEYNLYEKQQSINQSELTERGLIRKASLLQIPQSPVVLPSTNPPLAFLHPEPYPKHSRNTVLGHSGPLS